MILSLEEIHTYYGTSHVLQGVSLHVEPGEVVCLLGRNGAGKTTTFRSIMGLTPPREGQVLFQDRRVSGFPPFHICRLGIGYVPEDRQIFPDLTVQEHLEVAQRGGRDGSKRWTLPEIYKLFPDLKHLRLRLGGQLSGGEQQMLTIARTLMGSPKLLLLDEPSEGLAPRIIQNLMESIEAMKKEVTILMSEQNVRFAMRLADRGYIIEKGKIKYEGTMEELGENEEIQQRYLTL